ncbi:hypothetical protein E2320_006088 [Naja naja]|nr:hypothetical protein E2320_006088 [Naja naja]
MGLEKEKADTKIFMEGGGFSRDGSPAPSETDKHLEKAPDRDPHGLNSHLKLGFEDVIAEPAATHSFDKVWVCSHALFELSKYLIYKLLTFVFAVPLALVAGIVFAVLSCLHICKMVGALFLTVGCDAVHKVYPFDLATHTSCMEELDRCFHCTSVSQHGTVLFSNQHTFGPRVNNLDPMLF